MKQSKHELIEHLNEQRDWLRASCERYDSGVSSEAKRMASIVRTLLNETTASHALLAQLSLLGQLQFADTAASIQDDPTLLMAIGLTTMGFGPDGVLYRPILDNVEHRTPFQAWWNNTVIKSPETGTFTRERIIKSLANKDGGSHVDPKLPGAYRSLTKQNGIGWIADDGNGNYSPLESPVLPAMRTIAHEVEVTLAEQLPALL